MSKTTYISEVNGQKVYAERAGYTTNGVNIDTALSGKQDDLGISAAGSATEFLNEQGNFVPVSCSNMAVPRSSTDYDNDQPGMNKAVFIEKGNTSTNTPYNSWHYLMAMTGGDADYCTQVAFPMQNDNRMFYRTHHANQGWSDWQEVARTSQVPIYVTSSDTFSTIETAYTAGRLPFYKYTDTFSSRKIAIPMQLIRVDYTDNTFTTIQAFEFGFVDYTDSNLYGKLWKIKCDRTSGWGSLFGTLPAALQNMYNTSATDFNDFNSTLNSMKFQATDINHPHAPNTTSYFNVWTGIGGNTGYQTQIATECGNAKTGLYVRTKYGGTWTGWKEMAAANGAYPNMAVGTLLYGNATFNNAASGCNVLIASVDISSNANDQRNLKFFVELTDADTSSNSVSSAELRISARNYNVSPYTTAVTSNLVVSLPNNMYKYTVNVTFDQSLRRLYIYATTLSGGVWGGVRLIPLEVGDYGTATNQAGYLTLYQSVGTTASNRLGTDVSTTVSRLARIGTTQVGSSNIPVYVNQNGQVQQCSTYISMDTAVADSNVLCVF